MDITGVDLTDPNTCFQSPLSLRYASPEMKYLYSDQFKFQTWREMWVILAKAQLKLKLPGVSQEQVTELENNTKNIDFKRAKQEELERRHDVMAHVHTFAAAVSEESAKIIHLGATSCFVGDNTDLIVHKKSLEHIQESLAITCQRLRRVDIRSDRMLTAC